MRRVIIIGTGTEVGKTYVTSRLAEMYRAQGGRCLALKPVESGVSELDSSTSDWQALKSVADAGAPPLYSFAQPISPHLAARYEGIEISTEELVTYVEQKERDFLEDQSVEVSSPLSARPNLPPLLPPLCLIETAGGVFTPLSDSRTNWDLAKALRPQVVILVAPDSLGVLNEVQACLRAMRPILPHCVILSESRPRDTSTGTNRAEIERVVLAQLGLEGRVPVSVCPRQGVLDQRMLALLSGGS